MSEPATTAAAAAAAAAARRGRAGAEKTRRRDGNRVWRSNEVVARTKYKCRIIYNIQFKLNIVCGEGGRREEGHITSIGD